MSLRNAAILLFSFWLIAFVGTHVPGSSLRAFPIHFENLDKIVHFGLFFVLSGLIANVVSRRIRQSLPITLITVFFSVGYAAVDELSQSLVPNRSCDIRDFLADICGVAAGLLAFHVARHLKNLIWPSNVSAAKNS